jgi:pimeloyl-ACP methyl ester carboxylesterase
MALRRPERVASLVLGGTAAFDTPRGSRLDVLKAAIPFGLAMRMFPSALYGPLADPAGIAEDLRLMEDARTPFAGRRAQSRAVNAHCSRSRVHLITAPTLVVHGEVDEAVPVERGRELAELIPGAQLRVLPDGGHNYLVDKGAAGQAAVLDFLAAQEPVLG